MKKSKISTAGAGILVHHSARSVAQGKITISAAMVPAVPSGAVVASESGPVDVELPIDGGFAIDGGERGNGNSLNSPAPSPSSDAVLAGQDPAPSIGITDLDGSLITSGKMSFIQDQTASARETQGSASAKEREKIQAGSATTKIEQRSVSVPTNTAAITVEVVTDKANNFPAVPIEQIATSAVSNPVGTVTGASHGSVFATAKFSIGPMPVMQSVPERREGKTYESNGCGLRSYERR